MANSLLVLMPHEQTHGAFSILKQVGILSPDGTKARAVKNVMKLIANSLSVAKVAPTEMAGKAGSNKPALLNSEFQKYTVFEKAATFIPRAVQPQAFTLG